MLLDIVINAARSAKLGDLDGAALAVAAGYAELIDNAAPAAKYDAALGWLAAGADQNSPDVDKHIRTITVALAQHSVASDLGPKLLAALESLQLTPRARAAAQKVSPGDQPRSNPIDQLAVRRAGRRGAPAVDAAAP